MFPVRLVRLAVLVGEETTEEQLAGGVVGAVRLWYQSPVQWAMVSVAESCVTLLALSATAAGDAAAVASDSGPSPVTFTARTLYW